jgi:hypothetical protein
MSSSKVRTVFRKAEGELTIEVTLQYRRTWRATSLAYAVTLPHVSTLSVAMSPTLGSWSSWLPSSLRPCLASTTLYEGVMRQSWQAPSVPVCSRNAHHVLFPFNSIACDGLDVRPRSRWGLTRCGRLVPGGMCRRLTRGWSWIIAKS